MKQNGLSFDVLSDQGNAVAQQFGLAFPLAEDVRPIYLELFKIDLSRFNGDDSWTLPMPARFIIDQRSIIRAAEVNPDYTVRPEPSETVAALRAMQTGTVKS